jgi:hypothetical protein
VVIWALALQVSEDCIIQLLALLDINLLLFFGHLVSFTGNYLVNHSVLTIHLFILNGLDHFIFMSTHRSAPDGADLLANDLAAWMFLERLRVQTIEIAETSHGGITDES